MKLITLGYAGVRSRPLSAVELDPRVQQVLDGAMAVDMHTHSRAEASFSGTPVKQDDIPGAMKRASLTAVSLTYAVDGPLMGHSPAVAGTRSNLTRDPRPGEMYANHLKALSWMDHLVSSGVVSRALNFQDLRNSHQQGRPVIIQDAEGADFLEGHLERVQELYRRGTRILQLVHYATNPIGDFQTGPEEHHGLTEFGRDVVKECNKLGIVVDVAHSTFATVKGVTDVCSQPLVLSHTALKGSRAQGSSCANGFRGGMGSLTARQVAPDHAKLIAATGGVIGVWHLFANARDFVAGIKEFVDIVGIDHVGIGTDMGIQALNTMWPDESYGLIPTIINEMLEKGFSGEECRKVVGGNFCRVFQKCTERTGSEIHGDIRRSAKSPREMERITSRE